MTLGRSLAFSRLQFPHLGRGGHDIFTIYCVVMAIKHDEAREITSPAACQSRGSISGSWEVIIGGRGRSDECRLWHRMWVPVSDEVKQVLLTLSAGPRKQ